MCCKKHRLSFVILRPFASITANLRLFHKIGLPLPPSTSGVSILIWRMTKIPGGLKEGFKRMMDYTMDEINKHCDVELNSN